MEARSDRIVLSRILLFGSLLIAGCGSPASEEANDLFVTTKAGAIDCPKTDEGISINLDCPEMPNVPMNAKKYDWDSLAWNSFIALNWPAVYPPQNNDQRGFPDTTLHFTDNDTLRVWETWREKRELFVYPPNTNAGGGKWNGPVNYYNHEAGVNACSPQAQQMMNGYHRLLAQATKTNSLDEAAEVPSEAREEAYLLCGEADPNFCRNPRAHKCCQVKGRPVEPIIWKGLPDEATFVDSLVRFEVKLNFDYWHYVDAKHYYIDSTKNNAVTSHQDDPAIRLPFRVSTEAKPGQENGFSVTRYNAAACVDSLNALTSDGDLNPCLSGAIQTKSAWIMLPDNAPHLGDYHTTRALYYKTQAGGTCLEVGTFGLIGFHIIQRFHKGSEPRKIGGAFLFASWEHKSLEKASGSGYYYSNYYQGPDTTGFFPSMESFSDATIAGSFEVRRFSNNPILQTTKEVNERVHARIAERNPRSVWLNYELIGTQYMGVPNTTDPVNPDSSRLHNQPYYLANLALETNSGLQNFQGVPPGKTFLKHWGIKSTKQDDSLFQRTHNNLFHGHTPYNMGGCMGCHGVAQLQGYSFSFVLLRGQRGANPETAMRLPDPFEK